jgi:hypothetical protein
MQAGLTKRQLTLREIFSSRIVFFASGKIMLAFVHCTIRVSADDPA